MPTRQTYRREDKKPQQKTTPPSDSDDTDDETPTTRSTRQPYKTFHGTPEQEHQMLLTALRTELRSNEANYIKQTLQKNIRNRILRSLQDDNIEFEKLIVNASKAFSLTWVKQVALGKLQYKQTFLTKYAHLTSAYPTPATATTQHAIKNQTTID
jgi:hypothetical protein